MLGLTCEHTSDKHAFDTCILDRLCFLIGDFMVDRDDDLSGVRIHDVLQCIETGDAIGQGLDDLVLLGILDCGPDDSVDGSAVILVDDDVLGDIDKSSCKVSGLSGLESGIGQSLSGSVGGDEELDDRKTFLEVGLDREGDDVAVRLGHQSSHSAQLPDLGLGSSCS